MRMSARNYLSSGLKKINVVIGKLRDRQRIYLEGQRRGCGTETATPRLCQANNIQPNLARNLTSDWHRAITEARDIVLCPISPPLRRWANNDEYDAVQEWLTELAKFHQHPVYKVHKILVSDESDESELYKFISLLISKAAGYLHTNDTKEDMVDGILRSQRVVAEVTEMAYVGFLVHQSVTNIKCVEPSKVDHVRSGNDLSILVGDYFFSEIFAHMANIKNQEVTELMLSALRDMAQADFVNHHYITENKKMLHKKENCAVNEWINKNEFRVGALLGKSCQSALMLAKSDEEIHRHGFNFGNYFALAWQATLDLSPFTREDPFSFSDLSSAPVMFHVDHDPSLLEEITESEETISNINYQKVYETVMSGPGVKLTKQLQDEYCEKAMEVLDNFEENNATAAIINIISSMKNAHIHTR